MIHANYSPVKKAVDEKNNADMEIFNITNDDRKILHNVYKGKKANYVIKCNQKETFKIFKSKNAVLMKIRK